MARGRVHVFRMARGRPVAATVIRRAQMRAALDDLAGNFRRRQAGVVALYGLLRLQSALPLNPQELSAVAPHLALNTAVSFVTNTSWQSYSGETTLSYASQMAGITVQSFLSAASGIAVVIALIRGFARRQAATSRREMASSS